MTDHYEDEDETRQRVLKNRQVAGFISGFWWRRPLLLAGTVGLTLAAIGFDLSLPWASGRLVDAVGHGPSHPDPAWRAWAIFVGVYLAFSVIRNLAMRFLIPMSANNMKDMTDEAFERVQSFSADWHADTFAGATVRRLTRAMWGYDTVTDAALIWFGPAAIVLIGLCVMMAVRWPLVGAFAGAVALLYVVSNVVLTSLYARPANLKSVALDSRIGGALADSISSNATVKAFGAEPREEARIAGVTELWRRATIRTWSRFTNLWLWHNLLLVVLQAGLTGLLLRQWMAGRASAGDIAFAITSFMLMTGYLGWAG